MKTIFKIFLTIFIIALALSLIVTWYKAYIVGQYYLNASIFLGVVSGSAPILVILGAFMAIKEVFRFKLEKLIILLVPVIVQSCDYAHSNVQTLITDDCGVSWKVIKAGEAIPKRLGVCAYKVTVPDYPMQGESKFRTAFKDRVLANIEVTYDYSITDPVLFISEAKYLGKANSASDDSSNSSGAYETAENAVIDKRIKEVTRDLLIHEDIVEFSQADFEDKLIKDVNKLLEKKGVLLNFLSFVPIPEEQTRLAIDVVTASKIYKSKDLDDVGKSVSAARAGATKIDVIVQRDQTSNE